MSIVMVAMNGGKRSPRDRLFVETSGEDIYVDIFCLSSRLLPKRARESTHSVYGWPSGPLG